MDSVIVIKVNYEETVRRFSAPILNGEFDLSMDKLKDKIVHFFKFTSDTEFILTYIDEDNDVVTLVDDDDLRDVVRQGLNPLRITVKLSTKRSSESSSTHKTCETSTQLVPSVLQDLLLKLNGQDPVSRILTEGVKLMNLSVQQSDPGAPAHGKSTNGTVTGDTGSQKINKAGSSAVSGTAGLTNVLSDNQAEKVSTIDKQKKIALDNKTTVSQIMQRASQTKTDTDKSLPVKGATVSKNVPREKEAASQESTSNVPSPNEIPSFSPPKTGHVVCSHQNPQPVSTHGDDIKSWLFPPSVSEVGNPSANPLPSLSFVNPIRNHIHRENPGSMTHRGVRCDGCGVHPITGTRFKSTVKEDYDLCSRCFERMGNEDDYTRIYRPLTYNKRLFPFKGSFGDPRWSKLDSIFIQDISISDGTLMAPSTQFTKIWRMKNSGTAVWPQGTQLVRIGGDRLTNSFYVELEIPKTGLPVGNELDIAVDCVAPRHPGQYISYWRMVSPSGYKFGQRIWVLIQVDVNELPSTSLHSFNLNLPPVSTGLSNPETMNNMNYPEAMAKGSLHDEFRVIEPPAAPSSDENANKLSEPLVALPVQMEEEQLNTAINDGLFVGDAVAVAVAEPFSPQTPVLPAAAFPSPIEELLKLSAPPPPPTSKPMPVPITEPEPAIVEQTSSTDLSPKPYIEATLLKELEEMGFKEVELNKKVLRQNEYNMEKSIDYLCGMSEWDPILEELNEMGFCDEDKNRELLKKNNGSVKRVVMDLLGGDNV